MSLLKKELRQVSYNRIHIQVMRGQVERNIIEEQRLKYQGIFCVLIKIAKSLMVQKAL